MTDQVVVRDPDLDISKMIFEGIQPWRIDRGQRKPVYTVSEVGKLFFGRSAHWVRLCEKQGLYLDGEEVEVPRREGVRFYTMDVIEHIAHALAQSNRISVIQLRWALRTLKLQGLIWEILPPEGMLEALSSALSERDNGNA